MSRTILTIVIMMLNLPAVATTPEDTRNAIARMLREHPYSTYQDIYKSFFQDAHGPGHLLGDTIRAKDYLTQELQSDTVFAGPLTEPTGYGQNFVRVNLRIIADGTVSADDYFRAFTCGLERISPPEADDWHSTWIEIDRLMPPLPDGEQTRADILHQLESGNPVVHHSRIFVEKSGYHYRIISRDAFDRFIAPKLADRKL